MHRISCIGVYNSNHCEYYSHMSILMNKIKQAVDESSLSQRQIARGSGISSALLCLVMQGKRGMTADRVEQVLGFLGYDIKVFKREEEEN